MLFTTENTGNRKIEIFCNNNNDNQYLPSLIQPIEQISDNSDLPAVKFLGVYFDPNLNFKYHINTFKQKTIKVSLCNKNGQKLSNFIKIMDKIFSIW